MFVFCFFIYLLFCFQRCCVLVVLTFIGSYAADWYAFAVVVINKHCHCVVPGQPALVRKLFMKMFLRTFSIVGTGMSLTSAV